MSTPTASSPTIDQVNRRPVFLLLFASVVAAIGNGISIVALPWLVLQRTGSAADAAIVAAAGTLPLVFSTLISGTAVDFFGRRKMSIASDVLSFLSVSAIPILAMTTGLSVPLLAALAAVGALFDPAGITARESMLPAAAKAAGWSLDRMNSMYEAAFNVAYIVGPGLGGLLIAAIGGVNTMWATAATFVVSILAIAFLKVDGSGAPATETRPTGVFSGAVEGLKFVWSVKILRTLALIDMAITALYLPIESVLFPKYFSDKGTPQQLGWVLMAISVGGLIGALGYATMVRHVKRRTIMLCATFTAGATTLGMSLLPPIAILLVLCACLGFIYGPVAPIANYVMQTRSPEHLRGRVVGVMTSTAYCAGPLGFMLAGPIADQFGIASTLTILGVPMLLIAIASTQMPVLRELDHAEPQPS
ncbi:MFS transporter [Mycobacterium sp. CBMA271]|uniref:MFS transporter n=1 Tax=unclassified Mycobacteroides TaxID=2618759 RepID=UPI0012DEAC49|nr:MULTISPECIES: MFS transporter [unclassified Mycobacteroides]MUM16548.1 MFS transporter [Mycobacteroides sp. CBMA 326]MUM22145.1 MFS transporter [Mycobacteroides sp. CBMA 271]